MTSKNAKNNMGLFPLVSTCGHDGYCLIKSPHILDVVPAFLLRLAGCDPMETQAMSKFIDYHRFLNGARVYVYRVIDGDTIYITLNEHSKRYIRIRLIGVNAPEFNTPFTNETFFAKESKQHLKDLIEHQYVILHVRQYHQRDKYNRVLAYVSTMSGADVNLLMIADGFARAYRCYPYSRKKVYCKAEELAKSKRFGAWKFTQVWNP